MLFYKTKWPWIFSILKKSKSLRLQLSYDQLSNPKGPLKVHLHAAIRRADFVSWCMLYTYEGKRMHS